MQKPLPSSGKKGSRNGTTGHEAAQADTRFSGEEREADNVMEGGGHRTVCPAVNVGFNVEVIETGNGC